MANALTSRQREVLTVVLEFFAIAAGFQLYTSSPKNSGSRQPQPPTVTCKR